MIEDLKMVSNDTGRAAASGLLLISNLLSTVRIEKLNVPELVQKGNTVVLDCDYTVYETGFTIEWFYDGQDLPLYSWSPPADPIVRGVLEKQLDLSYRASLDPLKERRALRILQAVESFSGEYTCVVKNPVSEARKSACMLVFSPQQDLTLDWHQDPEQRLVQVSCTTRGVYPQPHLLLERDHKPIDRQQLKVWRSGDGGLFDATTLTEFRTEELRNSERFTCRLDIADAGYVAMSEKIFVFRNSTHDSLKMKPVLNENVTVAGSTSLLFTKGSLGISIFMFLTHLIVNF